MQNFILVYRKEWYNLLLRLTLQCSVCHIMPAKSQIIVSVVAADTNYPNRKVAYTSGRPSDVRMQSCSGVDLGKLHTDLHNFYVSPDKVREVDWTLLLYLVYVRKAYRILA